MEKEQLARLVRFYQQKLADSQLENGQLVVAVEDLQAELEALKLDKATAGADAPAPAAK